MNPNVKFTLNFQTKEAETVVGGFLKKIQYNQENEDAQTVNASTTISSYPKKRKAVTYASKPPLQKKPSTAFSYAPLNNFDDANEPSIPAAKPAESATRQEATKPLAAIDNTNETRKDAPRTTKLTVQKKISSSFAPINNFDENEETPKDTSASSERDALSSLDNKSRDNSRVSSRSPTKSEARSTDKCVTPPRRQPSPFKSNQTSSQGSNQGGSPIRNGTKQRSPTSSPRSSSGQVILTGYPILATLVTALTKILRLRISHPNEMIEQDDLQKCIARTSERFTKHQQEDSHEYLTMCLNKLHNDTVEISQELDDSCYEKDGKRCPVDDHFQCRVTSTLSCTQCSWSSTHFEVFRDLSLNLPDSTEWQCSDPIGVDIPTLLYQYFMVRPTLNLGPWCTDEVNIPEKSISSQPEGDSDFDHDNEQQGDPVVHPYLASDETKENGLRPLAELQRLAAAEYKSGRGVRVEYKLQSVVSHHGGTIKRGHFVCDVRQEDGWSIPPCHLRDVKTIVNCLGFKDTFSPLFASSQGNCCVSTRTFCLLNLTQTTPQALYSSTAAALQHQEKLKLTPSLETVFSPEFKFIQNAEPIPAYRVMDQSGKVLDESQSPDVSKEFAVNIYQKMLTLNIMDNILYEAQRQGRISFYMTHYGEEAFMGSAAAFSTEDVVFGQYREATVLMYRGFTMDEFMNQCYSNDLDYGKGRQMPVHYGSKKLNFQTISSPLGTQIPQATGAGYALKLSNRKACAVCFFGEGAASEGDFHAGMNMAATLSSPVVFICRNNGYAISTPSTEQYKGDGIASRGVGYGMDTIRVDGNDVWAVYNASVAARKLAVEKNRPVLIEAMTYRVGHHSTSDDSSKYRDRHEVERRAEMDNPIARLRKWLELKEWWTKEEEDNYRKEARKGIMKSFLAAEKRKKPSVEELFTDVYDELPPNLVEQRQELADLIKKYPEHYTTDHYVSGLK
ncbi:hypothetical protein INT44_001927 [Umbelopsis vinacea]|uniref:3-methyl-2-oxobutanoate dehydrogenase (2-methylpropanoyl-transferring) n=1 Tax=Umbelopsis vinacea TaxID=44442 RepID=A0A8H7UKJ2_9FUNG|nr:hypothetical protein INT44_001927 [Umbelopsis vinacea]